MFAQTCPACRVGKLALTPSVYMYIQHETLISAPNVPAWCCDVCGIVIFDPAAIRRIELLVGEAGPPPNQHVASAPPPVPADDPDVPDESRPRPE
ncbi:MAG: YgiT-type zinc finger protein [Chloroflexi bacterium]|nr:YgiT-type zinc finger protein [Chloroflexota bacterium]